MPWNLTGNAKINDKVEFLGTTDNHALVVKTNDKEALRVAADGNVAIGGSANGTCKLEVHAQDGIQISGNHPFFTLSDTNSAGTLARVMNADGNLVFYTQDALTAGTPTVIFNSPAASGGNPSAIEVHAQDGLMIVGPQPFLTLDDAGSGYQVARIRNVDGKLQFYTQSAINAGYPNVIFNSLVAPAGSPPPTAIEVHAQDGMMVVGYEPFVTLNDSSTGYKVARLKNANGDLHLSPQSADSAVIIRSGTGLLDVRGDVQVGGDILLAGLDCAENFEVAEDSEPGTVLVIDENGALIESFREYDRKVAGVVSGAGAFRPGIVLGGAGQDERGGAPGLP